MKVVFIQFFSWFHRAHMGLICTMTVFPFKLNILTLIRPAVFLGSPTWWRAAPSWFVVRPFCQFLSLFILSSNKIFKKVVSLNIFFPFLQSRIKYSRVFLPLIYFDKKPLCLLFIDQLTHGLIHWSIDWLMFRLIDRSFDCLKIFQGFTNWVDREN